MQTDFIKKSTIPESFDEMGISERIRAGKESITIFTPDVSISMGKNGKGAEQQAALQMIYEELALPKYRDGFRVATITFATEANLVMPVAAPDPSALPLLSCNGGSTYGAPPLELAIQLIADFKPRADRKQLPPWVVFLSDGALQDSEAAIAAANRLREMGATVIAIGFGDDVDAAVLKRIATDQYYVHADIGALIPLFKQVAKTVTVAH